VVSAKAIESPDPILSKAAVDAVMQWEFVPAEKNGKKVNVLMEVPFTFALDAPK
jgi:outer membrane biosynthesis protein TonB